MASCTTQYHVSTLCLLICFAYFACHDQDGYSLPVVLLLGRASAFSLSPKAIGSHRHNHHTCANDKRCHRAIVHLPLRAKPPPSSKFDLDAIESFEADLLERERRLIKEAGSSSADTDDVEGTDDVSGETVLTRVYTVPPGMDKMRIDAVVASLLESDDDIASSAFSRSFCGNLVTDGQVRVNGLVESRKSTKVSVGSEIQVQIPQTEKVTEIVAQNLPLDILFEDEHMIVLNKAAGMVVHPAAGNWDGTVVNALAYYLQFTSPYSGRTAEGDEFPLPFVAAANSGIDEDDGDQDVTLRSLRPGIVHRLDKGTTGVLVVAKTSAALTTLSEQFSARRVKKTYLAVTVGNPGQRVVIDKPIGRHPVFRQRMRVVPDPDQKDSSGLTPSSKRKQFMASDSTGGSSLSKNGRRALSLVDTIAFDGKLAFVQVRIETGRTHQIRVHLQDRHTPIYGDDIYGLADWNKRLSKSHSVSRPLLHAYKLQLQHPVSGESMVFQAPLADDMKKIAATIYPEGIEAMSGAIQIPSLDITGEGESTVDE